jgi:pSer/pThr/pTyr-binding forkhead associated (FHA) protein
MEDQTQETLADLARRVPARSDLCAEQIVCATDEEEDPGTDAALVDQWGRAHALRSTTTIGRDPKVATVAVLQSSISRVHAELRYVPEHEHWIVRDLGSSNGTFVDGVRIEAPVTLVDRALVTVAKIGFVLVADRSTVRARPLPAAARATRISEGADVPRLRLLSAAAGGMAQVGSTQVQLGSTQLALLELLAERWRDEPDRAKPVRGFVRSVELIAQLPWDTPHPEDNHVKQLVRRVRRALERAGLEDAIESRHGFGYRLLVQPVR